MLTPDKMGWKYHTAWMTEHAPAIQELLAHIAENGPVRSADFEHPRKGASGWWEWNRISAILKVYLPLES
ncbi:Uncharacterized protein conserved in bacteria [Klebsiella oxytoca]|nr:Uncharacterized protein conserved in bacteria [Klebsiella oxytoca]